MSNYNIRVMTSIWNGLHSLAAICIAAGVTLVLLTSPTDNVETAPTVGRVHIKSVPPGAKVMFDGQRLPSHARATPSIIINGLSVGTRHEIRVELAGHKPHQEIIYIPKNGGEVSVSCSVGSAAECRDCRAPSQDIRIR